MLKLGKFLAIKLVMKHLMVQVMIPPVMNYQRLLRMVRLTN
ncbi:hypothetical protein [Limosilactobacillus reuteri]